MEYVYIVYRNNYMTLEDIEIIEICKHEHTAKRLADKISAEYCKYRVIENIPNV